MAGRPKGSTNKNTIKTTTAKTVTEVKAKETDTEVITENNVIETKAKAVKKVDIPLNYDIPVKSNVQGGLTYVSKKTGYDYTWGETGDVEYIEYQELLAMRNGQKKFFEDNWILFEDTEDYTAEEIYKTLGVDKYYNAIAIFESLDDVFELSATKIEQIVPTLSKGYKENIASRACELIRNKDERLDSVSKISAFSKALGIDLTVENI